MAVAFISSLAAIWLLLQLQSLFLYGDTVFDMKISHVSIELVWRLGVAAWWPSGSECGGPEFESPVRSEFFTYRSPIQWIGL